MKTEKAAEALIEIAGFSEEVLFRKAEDDFFALWAMCPSCGYVSNSEGLLTDITARCPRCSATGNIPSIWPDIAYLPCSLLLDNASEFFKLAYKKTETSYSALAEYFLKKFGNAGTQPNDVQKLAKELEEDEKQNNGGKWEGILTRRFPGIVIDPAQLAVDSLFLIDRGNLFDKAVVIFSFSAFEAYWDALLTELFAVKGYNAEYVERKLAGRSWNTAKRYECFECLTGNSFDVCCKNKGLGLFKSEYDKVKEMRHKFVHARRYASKENGPKRTGARREDSVRALKFGFMTSVFFAALHNDFVAKKTP